MPWGMKEVFPPCCDAKKSLAYNNLMKRRKIESTQNPVIKEALAVREMRSRFRGEAFIIEGVNLLEGALKAGALRRVFYTEGFGKRHAPLMKSLSSGEIELFEVTERIIARLTETETPQGVAAVSSVKAASLDEVGLKGILVVIDGLQDPGNLGAIIRTSDAVSAEAVVLLAGTCDAFMGKTLRASSGSVFNIPIVYEERTALIKALKGKGVRVAATTLDAKQSLFDADLRSPLAFVFGNETSGVSAELREAAAIRLRIPIPGRAESLNVAAAAAVCLYEALRQQSQKR